MPDMAEMIDNESEGRRPAEPRRRNRPGAGRPREKTSYATLYGDLKARVGFAATTLREAADAEPAVAKALLNIALNILTTED